MNKRQSGNFPAQWAFTRLELLIVVIVIGILVVFALAMCQAVRPVHELSYRVTCISNLKRLGVAYRVWANDNGDHYPAATSVTKSGWAELFAQSNASQLAWTNYVILSKNIDDLRFLSCPADERKPAATRIPALTNISYFCAPDSDDTMPDSLLGGDRNLAPGSVPKRDYGYSPANDKGSNVLINSSVCWSLKMHRDAGNILLGDGSVQQTSSQSLRSAWLPKAMPTNQSGIRVLFP